MSDQKWQPTAEHINALPDPIRRYIHDLETRCDPAGDIRTIAVLRDERDALLAKCQALEAELERLKSGDGSEAEDGH